MSQPIAYCMNVHPAETLSELRDAITTQALAIGVGFPAYHLGLRIGQRATAELMANKDAMGAFQQLLTTCEIPILGVNGFPFGAFHGRTVKRAVYEPNWLDPRRQAYTLALADILSVCPNPTSITTVPLAYRNVKGPHVEDFYASILDTAEALLRRQNQFGHVPTLAIEPEPDCLLDSLESVLCFFHGLYRHPSFKEAYRPLISLCLDTCHTAVMGESPETFLTTCLSEGIPISRIQISAALETTKQTRPSDLRPFLDTIYLHQTRSPNGITYPNLIESDLSTICQTPGTRIHYHVPLAWEGSPTLTSTRHTLTPAFWQTVVHSQIPLEVETYTFDILPQTLSTGSLITMMRNDLTYLTQQLTSAKLKPHS